MAVNEEQLLRHFQSTGSREALRELLIAHQDRIYNACFQVLGRAVDAEDAGQEALLKLAEGARTARDADAFRGWIYRVSLRAAIDLWRRREATRTRETRAAMNRPAAPPLDDRERVALFEAMDGLDDRERSLLLEHYFEKVPLPDLGERRGVSAVAIWKRIDKAREKLKKLLLAGGFVAASARVGEALESTTPGSAAPAVVREEFISKVLAGGLAMGATKSASMSIAGILVLILLAVTGGGYLFSRSHRVIPRSASGDTPPAQTPVTDSHRVQPSEPLVDSRASDPQESASLPSALIATLNRYKAWNTEWKRRASAWTPSDDREALQRFQDEGWNGFGEAFEQINEDPATFLKFLQEPANADLLDRILVNLLGKLESMGGGKGTGRNAQYFKDFSPDLMDGLIALVKSGKPPLRSAILDFLGSVHDVPESYDALYEELMYDSDVIIQRGALYARWRQRPLDMATLEKILARYQTTTDSSVRMWAIKAISYSPKPETMDWLLRSLDSSRDPDLSYRLASAAATMSVRMTLDGETTERLVQNLIGTFEKLTLEREQNWLLWSALHMPPKDSRRVLEAALPKATTPKIRSAIKFTLEKADVGSPTWNDLQNHFWRMMKD